MICFILFVWFCFSSAFDLNAVKLKKGETIKRHVEQPKTENGKTSQSAAAAAPLAVKPILLNSPVTLFHSIDSGATFAEFAQVTADSGGGVRVDVVGQLTREQILNAIERDYVYVVQLDARRFAKLRMCQVWQDARDAVLTLHVDSAGAVYHLDLHVTRGGEALACGDATLLSQVVAQRQLAVRLNHGVKEKTPKVSEFQRKQAKKQRVAAKADSRPFLLKYWYYFIPAMLMLVFGGIGAPEEEQKEGVKREAGGVMKK